MDFSDSTLCSLEVLETACPVEQAPKQGSAPRRRKLSLALGTYDTEESVSQDADESPLRTTVQNHTHIVQDLQWMLWIVIALTLALGLVASLVKHHVWTVLAFLLGALSVFLCQRYTVLVQYRHEALMQLATVNSELVDSLFPSVVRNRLMEEGKAGEQADVSEHHKPVSDRSFHQPARNPPAMSSSVRSSARESVKNFMRSESRSERDLDLSINSQLNISLAPPIADHFPDVTVFFLDIAGFTAWSAERDPPQVFCLLETIYGEFDQLAAQLGVFKVETIGDSYMAVTGLPEPSDQHAITMVKFAYQCLQRTNKTFRQLQAVLGPGTQDLAVRIGLHSGPVTAGVLRGTRARFQLFGDTVNTASRMESTGKKGRIQLSQATARLLQAAGKARWIKSREQKIVAKGKGELTTYWVDPKRKKNDLDCSLHNIHTPRTKSPRKGVLGSLDETKEVLHMPPEKKKMATLSPLDLEDKYSSLIDWNTQRMLEYIQAILNKRDPHTTEAKLDHAIEDSTLMPPAEIVADTIVLPEMSFIPPQDVPLPTLLADDLHDFVSEIARLHAPSAAFGNFEHASHVTLAAHKLLGQIQDDEADEIELHQQSFGIASDPLTQFGLLLACLIHHVDLDRVWRLFMQDRFDKLRSYIYETESEKDRFIQVLVQCVVATQPDNAEPALRWHRAFDGDLDQVWDRRTMAVLEGLAQMACGAHCLQPWSMYQRWKRLYVDQYGNEHFGEDRMLPLVRRMQDSGVLGGTAGPGYVVQAELNFEKAKA